MTGPGPAWKALNAWQHCSPDGAAHRAGESGECPSRRKERADGTCCPRISRPKTVARSGLLFPCSTNYPLAKKLRHWKGASHADAVLCIGCGALRNVARKIG